jgi:hypothetical protein
MVGQGTLAGQSLRPVPPELASSGTRAEFVVCGGAITGVGTWAGIGRYDWGMLHAGLVKVGAVVSLLLQIWGGTGLDRTSFCVRPVERPGETAETLATVKGQGTVERQSSARRASGRACGCCQKEKRSSETALTSHRVDGCCIRAALPDDPWLPMAVRDVDVVMAGFGSAALVVELSPMVFAVTCGPDRSPPGSFAPRVAGLASTRLRL